MSTTRGGLGLICEVTVVNTITASGGSATVTVRECHGAAGDPEAACTTETSVLTEPVTAVTQCNDAINGGGGTLRCSVEVTNNFIGVSPGATDATVNQCVGSGDGITTGCDPFPATTSGATITQCNGSANGGTLVELTCTASGTMSSTSASPSTSAMARPMGVEPWSICSANITNNAVAPSPGGVQSLSGRQPAAERGGRPDRRERPNDGLGGGARHAGPRRALPRGLLGGGGAPHPLTDHLRIRGPGHAGPGFVVVRARHRSRESRERVLHRRVSRQ